MWNRTMISSPGTTAKCARYNITTAPSKRLTCLIMWLIMPLLELVGLSGNQYKQAVMEHTTYSGWLAIKQWLLQHCCTCANCCRLEKMEDNHCGTSIAWSYKTSRRTTKQNKKKLNVFVNLTDLHEICNFRQHPAIHFNNIIHVWWVIPNQYQWTASIFLKYRNYV